MSATPQRRNPAQGLSKGFPTVYPDTMREFVQYSAPLDWTPREILAELQRRWEAPYPGERTIYEWRAAGRDEREKFRREVWAKEWAENAGTLIPLCLNSLRETLLTCRSALRRAEQAENDKAIPNLARAVVHTASEMLTHLGAPTIEAQAQPEQIRAQAVALWVGEGRSQAEAEALFDALAGVAAKALPAGEPG